MRICRVATIPFFLLHHLRSQIDATVRAGHEVYLVTSPATGIQEVMKIPGINFDPIAISRQIAPLADLRALVRLFAYFLRGKFDIVHSTTPKAGLLCAIAGFLAGVPVRLHTFTGQAWMELTGPVRWSAKASDWLIVRLNTQCYADSESQRAYLVAQGVADAMRIKVLGAGSLAGIDLEKLDIGRLAQRCQATKMELSLPVEARVITFIGRVTRDKGIVELVQAFSLVHQQLEKAFLLLVGPFEPEQDPLPSTTLEEIRSNPNIKVIGYHPAPENYLAISHVLCLPSYREGFGNVVIEAAALGIPTVGTAIVGLKDAVVDGETGVLVPPRDSRALADAIISLLQSEQRRLAMGLAAQKRAVRLFDAKFVNSLVLQEYEALFHGALPGERR